MRAGGPRGARARLDCLPRTGQLGLLEEMERAGSHPHPSTYLPIWQVLSNAARGRALAGFLRQLGDQVQLLFALVVVERHGRDDQRVDSGVPERADALLRAMR